MPLREDTGDPVEVAVVAKNRAKQTLFGFLVEARDMDWAIAVTATELGHGHESHVSALAVK
jgi:hypothetical protein